MSKTSYLHTTLEAIAQSPGNTPCSDTPHLAILQVRKALLPADNSKKIIAIFVFLELADAADLAQTLQR